MKSLDVFCICPVKSCSILTSAQQLRFLVTDDDMRLEALAEQTRHRNWLIYHPKKKRNAPLPFHTPIALLPFLTMYSLISSDDW